jgi:hypothetical protein
MRDGCHCLAGAGGVFEQSNRFPFRPHSFERQQGILLVFAQLQQLAHLAEQEVVERQEPRQALQEEGQLFLDALRLMGNLAVGPAEDAPALMDEAVLPQQIVLVLLRRHHLGDVPGQAIDLESDLLSPGAERQVHEPAGPVNVGHGMLW